MGVLPECPACGFASAAVRCPRCNALKVVGCDGRCSACAIKGASACGAQDSAGDAGVDSEVTSKPTAEEPK